LVSEGGRLVEGDRFDHDVGIGAAAGRLDPQLGHAEQPGQRRLLEVDRLDPLERDRALLPVEPARPEPERAAGDLVGAQPPVRDGAEHRERGEGATDGQPDQVAPAAGEDGDGDRDDEAADRPHHRGEDVGRMKPFPLAAVVVGTRRDVRPVRHVVHPAPGREWIERDGSGRLPG